MVTEQEIESRIQAWAEKKKPAWFAGFRAGGSLPALAVDSLEAVRFVAFLQAEFSVSITPQEFFGGAFASLASLVKFLQGKLG